MKKIVLKITKSEIQDSYDGCAFKCLNNNLNMKIDEALKSSSKMPMEKIRKSIVPIVKDCDIFISYSHDDEEIATYVANVLMNNSYKVFIDSFFWKSIDDSQVEFDEINSKDNGKLSYDKVRQSASTFNMILADSLIDTIKSSKIFIFINTGKLKQTLSPWLYLENKIANEFENELKHLKEQLVHDSRFSFSIEFPLKTSDFYTVNSIKDLLSIIKK
ncbi:MAG: hypothetical protein ACOX4W_05645 [Bacilli bacterium]